MDWTPCSEQSHHRAAQLQYNCTNSIERPTTITTYPTPCSKSTRRRRHRRRRRRLYYSSNSLLSGTERQLSSHIAACRLLTVYYYVRWCIERLTSSVVIRPVPSEMLVPAIAVLIYQQQRTASPETDTIVGCRLVNVGISLQFMMCLFILWREIVNFDIEPIAAPSVWLVFAINFSVKRCHSQHLTLSQKVEKMRGCRQVIPVNVAVAVV